MEPFIFVVLKIFEHIFNKEKKEEEKSNQLVVTFPGQWQYLLLTQNSPNAVTMSETSKVEYFSIYEKAKIVVME